MSLLYSRRYVLDLTHECANVGSTLMRLLSSVRGPIISRIELMISPRSQ